MHVKIFSANSPTALEAAINQWAEDNAITFGMSDIEYSTAIVLQPTQPANMLVSGQPAVTMVALFSALIKYLMVEPL